MCVTNGHNVPSAMCLQQWSQCAFRKWSQCAFNNVDVEPIEALLCVKVLQSVVEVAPVEVEAPTVAKKKKKV